MRNVRLTRGLTGRRISEMDALSSSAAAATVWTLDDACPAAAATATDFSFVLDASVERLVEEERICSVAAVTLSSAPELTESKVPVRLSIV